MRKIIFIVFIFLIISNVSALCKEGQIDINSASEEELDELSGIGPAYAKNIVSARPFESIDDLIRTSGIGSVTLGKIKEQGLACVIGETEEIQEEQTNNETSQDNEDPIPIDPIEEQKTTIEDTPEEQIQSKIIKLNPALHENERLHENKSYLHEIK